MKRYNFLFLIIFLHSLLGITAYAQIKVACIGNSITAGFGLKKEDAYPYKLQALLGPAYKVVNYGVSGTTMLKDPNDGSSDLDLDLDQWSYWEADDPGRDVSGGKEQYDLALGSKPDIVIIKFGTNDARGENWRSATGYGRKNYYDHYSQFIQSFRAVNPNVVVYICYSLPFFKDGKTAEREQAKTIYEEVLPMIKQLAKKNNSHLIDLHSAFYDGLNKGLIMGGSDLIHPTADGTTLLAQEVYKAIRMNAK